MTVLYDDIGQNYAVQRQPYRRIAAAIEKALSGYESVLNVGAGTDGNPEGPKMRVHGIGEQLELLGRVLQKDRN